MLFTYIFQNNFLLPIILSKMTNIERHENEKKNNLDIIHGQDEGSTVSILQYFS